MAGPGVSPHEQPAGGTAEASTSPARAGLVLLALILVAAVANLNLAVANVALPDDRQGLRLVADGARTSSPSATRSAWPHRCSTSARSATATGAS